MVNALATSHSVRIQNSTIDHMVVPQNASRNESLLAHNVCGYTQRFLVTKILLWFA
jgi:hypothetical protein